MLWGLALGLCQWACQWASQFGSPESALPKHRELACAELVGTCLVRDTCRSAAGSIVEDMAGAAVRGRRADASSPPSRDDVLGASHPPDPSGS